MTSWQSETVNCSGLGPEGLGPTIAQLLGVSFHLMGLKVLTCKAKVALNDSQELEVFEVLKSELFHY